MRLLVFWNFVSRYLTTHGGSNPFVGEFENFLVDQTPHHFLSRFLKIQTCDIWRSLWCPMLSGQTPTGHNQTTMSPESTFLWWNFLSFSSHCPVVIPVIFQLDNLSTRLSGWTVWWTWPETDQAMTRIVTITVINWKSNLNKLEYYLRLYISKNE